jgi:hypothetical protein
VYLAKETTTLSHCPLPLLLRGNHQAARHFRAVKIFNIVTHFATGATATADVSDNKNYRVTSPPPPRLGPRRRPGRAAPRHTLRSSSPPASVALEFAPGVVDNLWHNQRTGRRPRRRHVDPASPATKQSQSAHRSATAQHDRRPDSPNEPNACDAHLLAHLLEVSATSFHTCYLEGGLGDDASQSRTWEPSSRTNPSRRIGLARTNPIGRAPPAPTSAWPRSSSACGRRRCQGTPGSAAPEAHPRADDRNPTRRARARSNRHDPHKPHLQGALDPDV